MFFGKSCCKGEKVCYNSLRWRRSSVVEQRNHNPLVRGPNPFAATKITNDPMWSFFILVFGIWRPTQGSDPLQKGGITPVPRSLGEVEFCKGVKRSETIPSPLPK